MSACETCWANAFSIARRTGRPRSEVYAELIAPPTGRVAGPACEPIETTHQEEPMNREYTPTTEQVRVEQPVDWQGLVLFVGDGLPIILGDTDSAIDVPDYVSHPVQRAVTVARLRAWADLIESTPTTKES